MCRFIVSAVFLVSCLLSGRVAFSQFVFLPLGDLEGGSFYSAAAAISTDGTRVVGESEGEDGYEAFRWSGAFEGVVGMGDLSGGAWQSTAAGVSDNGDYIVGSGIVEDPYVNEGFRWTTGFGSISGIGSLSAGGSSYAKAVSELGNVVVGESYNGSSLNVFRWVPDGFGDGIMTDLGFSGTANDVSADGTTIVGQSSDAYRWTASEGVVYLPDSSSGHTPREAMAISPDGSVIVGWGNTPPFYIEAFRWTEAEGTIALGTLPGDNESTARDVSAAGNTVVGSSSLWGDEHAFIWDAINGMRNLQDVLVNDYGAQLSGWTLQGATGISGDGTKIVGYGLNPDGNTEAWIAQLATSPPVLEGDYNDDGVVDAADYTVWRDYLGSGFDLNGNGDETGDSAGVVDAADYDLWKANYGNAAGAGAAFLQVAVPEPSTVGLALAALVVAGLRFRPRRGR